MLPGNVAALAELLREGGASAMAEYLRERGVQLEPGLTDEEMERVEQTFSFRFPPDLRALLQTALPVSSFAPNWRSAPIEKLREWLNWPLEGMCFDIEYNVFWLEEWGPKPNELAAAFETARAAVTVAPTL